MNGQAKARYVMTSCEQYYKALKNMTPATLNKENEYERMYIPK